MSRSIADLTPMPLASRINLRLLVAILCLLFPSAVLAQTVTVLQDSGDPVRRVDIAVLGDGYTSAEMGKFAADVSLFMNSFLDQQPMREYRSYFNLRRIDVASVESGTDHPELSPPVFKNTAFDATYYCSAILRLICVSTTKVLAAASVVPPSQRDLIIVIVNDSQYGGSGGPVAVASTNAAAVELILHETGHTFAFLADEYTTQPPACSDTTEPASANATKETNRAAIKWAPWISPSTPIPTAGTTLGEPGLYLGSRYCPNTLYRPTYDSKMRSLGRSYDQINTEEFVKRFYEFAPPIEGRSPTSLTLTLTQGTTQQFSVTTPQPATHALNVTWQLDGQQAATGATYTLLTSSLAPGPHTVTVSVADTTTLVRIDPGALLRDEATWNISVTGRAMTSYTLPSRGGYSGSTLGTGPLTVGHTSMQPAAGSSQAGLAIFTLRQNNVVVTEAAVPASPKITTGRIYAEVGSPVNTGIAISNPSASTVTVTFYYTDTSGANSPSQTLSIEPYGQIARFLDQSPFDSGSSFRGTLTFTSSAPVGAIALRGFYNERSEFLITTLPVLDLDAGAIAQPGNAIVFPHFAAGGGWSTRILLVNPGEQPLTGTLTFRDKSNGTPVTLNVEGQNGSTFNYSIAARSSRALATSAAGELFSGYVELVPAAGIPSPVGLAVFSFTPSGITTTEAGVPTVAASNTFLLYAEASGVFGQPDSMQTGLAVANTSPAPVTSHT